MENCKIDEHIPLSFRAGHFLYFSVFVQIINCLWGVLDMLQYFWSKGECVYKLLHCNYVITHKQFQWWNTRVKWPSECEDKTIFSHTSSLNIWTSFLLLKTSFYLNISKTVDLFMDFSMHVHENAIKCCVTFSLYSHVNLISCWAFTCICKLYCNTFKWSLITKCCIS